MNRTIGSYKKDHKIATLLKKNYPPSGSSALFPKHPGTMLQIGKNDFFTCSWSASRDLLLPFHNLRHHLADRLRVLLNRIFGSLGPSLHHHDCLLWTHRGLSKEFSASPNDLCTVLGVEGCTASAPSLRITPTFTSNPANSACDVCTVSSAALLNAALSERVCSAVFSTLFRRAARAPPW